MTQPGTGWVVNSIQPTRLIPGEMLSTIGESKFFNEQRSLNLPF